MEEIKLFNGDNWILADLDDKEVALISRRTDGKFTPGNLGYIDPSKIRAYYVGRYKKQFKGAPNLAIRIESKDTWSRSSAGTYYFYHGELKNENYEPILISCVLISDISGGKVNPDYVYEDNSGEVIPITTHMIETRLKKLEEIEIINEVDIVKLEKLAKAGGFDYRIEIKQLREINQQRILERYSSKDNLEAVLKRLERSWEHQKLFDEYSGDYEILEEFLGYLPKVNLPQDLKERTKDVLNNLAESYAPVISEVEEKLREETENLNSLKTEQQNLRKLAEGLGQSQTNPRKL